MTHMIPVSYRHGPGCTRMRPLFGILPSTCSIHHLLTCTVYKYVSPQPLFETEHVGVDCPVCFLLTTQKLTKRRVQNDEPTSSS